MEVSWDIGCKISFVRFGLINRSRGSGGVILGICVYVHLSRMGELQSFYGSLFARDGLKISGLYFALIFMPGFFWRIDLFEGGKLEHYRCDGLEPGSN